VSAVWCGVVVFIWFLVVRFSDVLGVPPPMWFGCLYVLVLFLVWRSEARLREAVLWVFGVRELCVYGYVIGRCVVPREGAWCWLSVGLVGLCVLMWYSFGCCACVLTVWFVFAVLCVMRSLVVGLVVKFVGELHREVRGSKAMLACGGLLGQGLSIGAGEFRR